MAIPLKKKDNTIMGGEIASRMLAAEGVEQVFGIIDGTYFGLISTLGDNGIKLITPRHESSAAHMAEAYARLTGKLGVCIASNGPGVANILPGIAVASAEGNRLLLITSSRRIGASYPDRGGTFQCFPQVEVTRPMTKWSCAVPSADRLAEILRKALRISWTGRPGVVHIDVPESIMNGTYELDPTWLRTPENYRVRKGMLPHTDDVAAAAELLRNAKRPLIHVGSGVIHAQAHSEVLELADRLEAVITTSWAARAAVTETSDKVVPMPYVQAVNHVRRNADVVLVLGSRVGETDWWGKQPYWGDPAEQKTIQVDLDAEIIGVNKPVDVAIQADLREFLAQLKLQLNRPTRIPKSRGAALADVHKKMAARRKKLDKHLSHSGIPMHPAHIPVACQEVFEDDAIMVIDGGNTAIWANFFHEVRHPNTIVTTPKMGMLGAGVSQTLAAKAAFPDRQVYCILGDGAMGFHPQEIETAIRNDLQVIYLVMCDKQWGMVKMNQQFNLKPIKTLIKKSLSPEETINTDLGEIEFDQLARSMGAHGERVADAAGLKGAIKRAKASGKCAVIHCDVDPVKHMWAPNLKDFKDMHGEPKG